MLDQPFQRLPRQIKAIKFGVTPLQFGDNTQGLRVMIEAACRCQAFIQYVLPGMAKRRVAEIMGERQSFGQILIQPQGPRQCPRDLRHLDGMGQAGAEMVAFMGHKNLRFMGEAAESGGMDNAVPVALKIAAWG